MAWYQRRVGAQAVAFERRAYDHPALRRVIAVSFGTAAEITRHYAVPADRITVVPNGVDPAAFDRARYPTARAALRAELRLATDAPVALLVGTYARKGLETAIAAVARASKTLHLVVAGAGSDRDARRWAGAAGIAHRLHLLGPRLDVARLYAAADLFVLPTRYEPFGMVITEAMASGLPVVVSACAGAADLIRHGESGFVVETAGDADGFAAAIRAVLADPVSAAGIGAAARAAILTTAWPGIVARTEAVYARAVGAA
jgi:UDP-glucose:(heptosyl)LPS alpha-1,3-glucosyltransferase